MTQFLISAAAFSGFLCVGIGAFGAHGLRARLTPAMMDVFQTGVHYQMFHTLALLAVGILSLRAANAVLLHWSGGLFLAGMVLFSGSLYLLALTEVRILGMITPLGGLAFLAGWLCLLLSVIRGDAA